jgi:hydroxypyruvate isomerase
MTTRPERSGPRQTRRTALRAAAALAAAGAAGGLPPGARGEGADQAEPSAAARGRLQQSVCRWCYAKIPLDDLCAAAKRMGLVGIDLLKPEDFPTLKRFGLACTMTSSHPLADGLCDPKFHGACLEAIHAAIEATAREGWKNVICFSGNARGIDREAGMRNCVEALKEVVPAAEKAGVVLQMELLNSKVNHKDYMCDNSAWGVELVKRVGSGHFKLLYDIYHMQIMEGDVIRTIEANRDHFGHYHTGGNPGRHELDDTQELNYRAIAWAIADMGFRGYVAHEFIPVRDPLTSLDEAVTLCRV